PQEKGSIRPSLQTGHSGNSTSSSLHLGTRPPRTTARTSRATAASARPVRAPLLFRRGEARTNTEGCRDREEGPAEIERAEARFEYSLDRPRLRVVDFSIRFSFATESRCCCSSGVSLSQRRLVSLQTSAGYSSGVCGPLVAEVSSLLFLGQLSVFFFI